MQGLGDNSEGSGDAEGRPALVDLAGGSEGSVGKISGPSEVEGIVSHFKEYSHLLCCKS